MVTHVLKHLIFLRFYIKRPEDQESYGQLKLRFFKRFGAEFSGHGNQSPVSLISSTCYYRELEEH